MSLGIRTWLSRVYDRLIAVVVLIAMFAALILLATSAQRNKVDQVAFDQELENLKPRHEKAAPADKSLFEAADRVMQTPPQIGEWPVRLLVPELRVRCSNCDRPIPYASTECSFCKATQPFALVDPFKKWLEKYGLNPADPDVDSADPDKDKFTNRQEYDFGTNPTDAADHPPFLAMLGVEDIKPIPFALVFQGLIKIQGETQFQINLRKGGKTYLAKIGQEVEGFKLVAFEENTSDGPVLTVERAGKQIPLIKNKVVPRSEYEVTLSLKNDTAKFLVRGESDFDLKGAKYRVKGVDMPGMRVLIHDPLKDKDVWIGRQMPEAQPAPEQ